jgi:cell division protein FtsI (penicillin-binding protein 3)
MTISYGHGISTSPVHLAAAYAAMVNGGTMVTPTLLRRDADQADAGGRARDLAAHQRADAHPPALRRDRRHGQLRRRGWLRGGGKTGSAEMPRTRGGGYYEDRNINTFAAVFPSDDAAIRADHHALRTGRAVGAGAAPHRGLDHRSGLRRADPPRRPLLGLRPDIELRPQFSAIQQLN